uniref:Polyadenylate-binding protein n=1 Tax=Schistocephalus solidus TaxID=70667 RepID=A0A0X3PHS5_SCHSO
MIISLITHAGFCLLLYFCLVSFGNSACVLQFRSERDCQAVYDECQTGKNVGGQTVQAQFSEGHASSASHGQQHNEVLYNQQSQKARYGADNYGSNEGCVLKIHNLSWSVTDEELLQEYPRAVSANVMLTDQGRSRGWGTVTFSSPEDCQAAESSSSGRVINGRPIRAEIQEGYRETNDEYRNRGRPYNDRQNDRDSYRGQSHYDDGRRFRGGRGGGTRGGGGGFGREREVRRFDDRRVELRRDRSPSPDRGQRRRGGGGGGAPGGGSRGPRITSAVIRRAPGDSSDSDFDGR